MNIAVFDFCETLVNFQSADRFIDFVIQGRIGYFQKFISVITWISKRLRFLPLIHYLFPEYNIYKRLHLLKIRGVEKDFIFQKANDYLNEVINYNTNSELLQKLRQHKTEGDMVIISSGGLSPYLMLFSEQEKVDVLFCSEIEFLNGRATGFLKGPDCMLGNKVRLLEFYLKSNPEIKFEEKFVYSDSITDLPLLSWGDNSFVISYNEKQNWVEKYNFQEIILSR
ncbi:HAD-IB family hydrolase [Bacteroidota bacterium]